MNRHPGSHHPSPSKGAVRRIADPLFREPEAGAFVVLVAASMILLMGIAALALDGGRMYDERRSAQNAADHASLAAAWASCRTVDPIAAGLASAASNGYENDLVDDFVTITDLGGGEFEAQVTSILDTTFAKVLSTNQVDVSARAVGYCNIDDSLDGYALFASGNCASPFELALTGSQQVIHGGVHSNGGLKINGNAADPSVIFGPVTYVVSPAQVNDVLDDFPANGGQPIVAQVVDPLPLPGGYDIEKYAMGGEYAAAAAASGEYFPSDVDVTLGGAIDDGLYYVDGDLRLDAITASRATFVATGQIELVGVANTLTQPYDPLGLSLFSNYLEGGTDKCNEKAIKWAGSLHDWSGVQYAPNGSVDMASASNLSLNGSILAYNMTISASEFTLEYDDSYKAEPATTIQLHE